MTYPADPIKSLWTCRANARSSRRAMIRIGSALIGLSAAGVPIAWHHDARARAQAVSTPAATPAPPGAGNGGPGAGPPGGNEAEALAEPFVGITTDGQIIPDLFPLHITGVSTEPIVQAASTFLMSLTEEQRAATRFPVDDLEWRKWSNVDSYQRQGVSLREMTDAQRAAAMQLLAASLSASGLEKTENTMKLNHTEGELMDDLEGFDEDLYWFTVMGEPSTSEPWGWQVDGHHLVINLFVLGDQVVMTPTFMGAEPTIAPEGTDYAGLSVLIPEQDKGQTLINALDEAQRAKAIINPAKTNNDMQAGAFSDNVVIPYQGLSAAEMTEEQRTQLLDVIHEYIGNLDDGHAAPRMDEVRGHFDETWFAWIGGIGPEAVFYYRIQSPVVLIEFDHQTPGPLGRSGFYQGATGPQRLHIHTVVRTPNGNDYGKDLLAEHYATSPHHVGTPTAQVMRELLAAF